MAHDVREFACKNSTLYSSVPISTMRIPFASEKHANIAKQVIDVDRELQPEVVKRTLTVEENTLVA